MMNVNQATLGTKVALMRGVRVDGVLAPVFSPPLKLDGDGNPLPPEEQPKQPEGKVSGGIMPDRGEGPRVICEFADGGWADVPLAVLELREPGKPIPATAADVGGAPVVVFDEAAMTEALDEIRRLRGNVDMLIADKEARDERAKLSLSPSLRFVTHDDVVKLIKQHAETIAESKVAGLRSNVATLTVEHSETRGLAEKASDDATTALAGIEALRPVEPAAPTAPVEPTPAAPTAPVEPTPAAPVEPTSPG